MEKEKNHKETSPENKAGAQVASILCPSTSLAQFLGQSIIHVELAPVGLLTDVDPPEQEGVMCSLHNWEEDLRIHHSVLQTLQVNQTVPVNEGEYHQLLAVAWPPGLLWAVLSWCQPLLVLLLCPGFSQVKPSFITGHHIVQETWNSLAFVQEVLAEESPFASVFCSQLMWHQFHTLLLEVKAFVEQSQSGPIRDSK